jgi:hypothetical protein
LQPENGLPISSWYDDPTDIELDKLYPLLVILSKVKDVRPYIKRLVKKDKILYDRAAKLLLKKKEKASLQNILDSFRRSQRNKMKTQNSVNSITEQQNALPDNQEFENK